MSDIEWAHGYQPDLTLFDLFNYAGHTMTVGIYANESGEDITWVIVSGSATPIEGGTYPKHFAEYEASEELSNQIISDKYSVENAQDMAKVIRTHVAHLIAEGIFQTTLQATINDLFRKGATAREISDAIAKAGN